jgi:hypothetical protein
MFSESTALLSTIYSLLLCRPLKYGLLSIRDGVYFLAGEGRSLQLL